MRAEDSPAVRTMCPCGYCLTSSGWMTVSGTLSCGVVCECGACREIQPQALARLVGWKMTLAELALRMRCSRCGKKAAEVLAISIPRLRGLGFRR